MAIADNYSPAKYQGNGTTVNFSFSFAILNQSFAMVIIETISTGAQVVKTLGSDYTVSFDDAGGVVTMNVAPTSGEYIIIGRDVSINQTTPYTTSRGFDGGEVEESFDKLTAIAQDLRDFDKRCISFPEGSAIEGVTFPATPSTGKALKWASNGNLVNSDNDPDEMVTLAAAQAVAAAASASAASGSATTASNWAIKTDAAVSGGEFSAKAHAIGGTGLTTGSAKDWATKAEDSEVVTGQYSALHWAAKSEGFADAAAASLSAAGLPDPATADTYLKRNAGNTAYESKTVAQVTADVGLPSPATADTYLKRNAGNTAYEAKTAANVLADIMSGTTANSTDIVLGKRMTNPNQVAFRVALSAEQSNVTGDGTAYKIPFNSASGTDLFNRGNCFNTSTFEFSAPVTGLYVFNAYIRFRGLNSSHTTANYFLVTSNGGQAFFGFFNPYALQGSYGGNELSLNGTCVLPMDAGDIAYVQATIYGGTKDADCRVNSIFSGYLLS